VGGEIARAFGREGATVHLAGRTAATLRVVADDIAAAGGQAHVAVVDALHEAEVAVRSKFLTWRAAARHMIRQRSGVILNFGGAFDWRVARQLRIGGIGTTFDAVEAMRRQFAAEVGPHGIRVVTLRTAGLPETIPADFEGYEQMRRFLVEQTLTGRAATLADVGNVAAFAASELACTVTGTINMTAGAVLD
jgi:3-oxoacyl-[acyl-carrier protein] reductase